MILGDGDQLVVFKLASLKRSWLDTNKWPQSVLPDMKSITKSSTVTRTQERSDIVELKTLVVDTKRVGGMQFSLMSRKVPK
ncbi:hypothetical protein TNCV_2000581 [Trichonephila clavipes]|nr:hypothetical protein TNCV_2000581 [Trichonephila clavipes]